MQPSSCQASSRPELVVPRRRPPSSRLVTCVVTSARAVNRRRTTTTPPPVVVHHPPRPPLRPTRVPWSLRSPAWVARWQSTPTAMALSTPLPSTRRHPRRDGVPDTLSLARPRSSQSRHAGSELTPAGRRLQREAEQIQQYSVAVVVGALPRALAVAACAAAGTRKTGSGKAPPMSHVARPTRVLLHYLSRNMCDTDMHLHMDMHRGQPPTRTHAVSLCVPRLSGRPSVVPLTCSSAPTAHMPGMRTWSGLRCAAGAACLRLSSVPYGVSRL